MKSLKNWMKNNPDKIMTLLLVITLIALSTAFGVIYYNAFNSYSCTY